MAELLNKLLTKLIAKNKVSTKTYCGIIEFCGGPIFVDCRVFAYLLGRNFVDASVFFFSNKDDSL